MLRRLALVLVLSSIAFAQNPAQLTIEVLAKGNIAGRTPETVKWSPDGTKVSFIQRDETGDQGELWYVDVATGKKAVLVAASKLNSLSPPTSKIADERQREWRSRYGVAAYHWAPDSKALLFDANGQLWYFRLDNGIGVQVTSSPDPSSDPKFSSDGKKLAYVRDHDLWVRRMPDGGEIQITTRAEGEKDVLNGEVDWVYAEELDVRSNYFWSPDDKQIAYLQMDERPVPTHPIVDFSQTHATAAMQKYPQPGDPNPVVRVGVISSDGGKTKWIDIPKDKDDYIPRFGWVRPGQLWIQVLNRAQDKLTLYVADAKSGKANAVLTETSDAWVNVGDDFYFFKNGQRLVWPSWRDGHTHLYLYSLDPQNAPSAQLVNQITKGDFEVTSLDAVDEAAGLVYFTANPDPRQRQLFSVRLDSTDMKQVSQQAGTHDATFAPNSKHYVNKYSALYAPPSLSLCAVGGSCSPIFEPKDISAFGFERPEWLELTAADGKTKLYGQLYLPPDAPSGTKIPVILHPYGGPSGQSVRDEWVREGGLFHVYLARKGFAILVVDNRGMANRGREFNAFLKGKFGPIELEDQLAALDQVLKKYPQLDGSRVGIYGSSYGGYMVLYGMTHTDRLKAGVSIAPVSNWKLYDSIYTERYLGVPAKNEAGYTSGSPTENGAQLHGALRIAHGTSDDNVHVQNTIQMTESLIKAGKPFELMLYPNKTHGISGKDALSHLYRSLEDHFTKHLMGSGGQAQ